MTRPIAAGYGDLRTTVGNEQQPQSTDEARDNVAVVRRSLMVLLLVSGCDPTSRKLSGLDCKPRKLSSVQACAGEDHSFQECAFFFRASGVPLRSWCEAMPSAPPAGGELSRCDWNAAAAWTPVPCATYNVRGAARCFACAADEHEAGSTYVYGYDASCSRGIEQVTCNVDAAQAGAKLGPVVF